MIDQTINLKVATASAASGIASFIFGVPTAVLLAAFAGASLSLSFSEPRKFLGSVMYVGSGTVTAAFCTPLVLHFANGVPDRAVAFVIGFATMHFLPSLAETLKTFPKELKDKWLSK